MKKIRGLYHVFERRYLNFSSHTFLKILVILTAPTVGSSTLYRGRGSLSSRPRGSSYRDRGPLARTQETTSLTKRFWYQKCVQFSQATSHWSIINNNWLAFGKLIKTWLVCKIHTTLVLLLTKPTPLILYQALEERGYFLINDQLQLACN